MTQIEIDWNRPPEVAAAIQAGMQQAYENADERWKRLFYACIVSAARKHARVTVDVVLDEYDALEVEDKPSTHNLSAIGPMMKQAAKDGVLTSTNEYVRSRREQKNGNLHRVWISRYATSTQEGV